MKNADVLKGFATLQSAELYYEVAGHGTPLVLVHAGIADHTMWDEQVEAFAEQYRVIRYDRRGFGKSDVAAQAFSHHEDLNGLMTFLNIEKAHFVGSSAGGATVIDFALQYPDKVLSLNLVASDVEGYEFEGGPPASLMNLFSALEQEDWARSSELAVEIWVDGPKRASGQVGEAIRRQVKTMSATALRNMTPAAVQPTPLDPPAITRLQELEMPTQIIVGSLDDDSIADIAERLVADIKGGQRVVIEDVAHMLNMEKPEAFNQAVLQFLKDIA